MPFLAIARLKSSDVENADCLRVARDPLQALSSRGATTHPRCSVRPIAPVIRWTSVGDPFEATTQVRYTNIMGRALKFVIYGACAIFLVSVLSKNVPDPDLMLKRINIIFPANQFVSGVVRADFDRDGVTDILVYTRSVPLTPDRQP